MRTRKITQALALSVFMLGACTRNIDKFNEQTKLPVAVPAGSLFSNAVRNLSDGLANASVNVNVFRFTVKHWAMAVYQGEANYDFTTRAIPQAWWSRMYKDVLSDLQQSGMIAAANADLSADVKANQLAIIDIMQVYTYSVLVNTFGNVPYSEALKFTNVRPKYDDAKTIYTDLLKRLGNDISKLKPASGAFSSSEDLVYGGNVSKWVKFANSLRMRLGMTIADVDDATAKAAVEASDAGAISSATDNGALTYLSSSPNTNPLYTDIVLGGRGDYVAAKDLMDQLISLSDPRKTGYFGTNNAGAYVGGVVGSVNTFADMSKPSDKVSAPNAPSLFLDYVETEFYRAEAKERGYNVAGTADQHYSNAVTASIIFWGGTAGDASAYLAKPEVAYATATGTWKQKIGFQKWIALYNRPYEAWTELRRLDYPQLTLPTAATSGFPNRFTYPGVEQQVNGDNYTSAATAIGGDKVETKLFWDKF